MTMPPKANWVRLIPQCHCHSDWISDNVLSVCGTMQAIYLPDDILQEITILASLSHPHLVNLIEIIDSDSSNYLYLVMEYMQVS